MDWILLNKDTPFLEFSTQEDEFGDVVALEGTWFSSLRPIGYKSLLSFLEGRRAPKHRKHIEQLLAQYGCRTLDGFLQVSHALSLNDTFWVKQADWLILREFRPDLLFHELPAVGLRRHATNWVARLGRFLPI